MKKASIFLSLLVVLGSGCLAANATVLSRTATSLKAYFPDEEAFRDGQATGYYFLSNAAASYGKGSADYNASVDAEIAYALQNENAATRGTDEHYYWWGYRVTLQTRR